MPEEPLERHAARVEQAYRARTPRSRALLPEASRWIAGGVSRETGWWRPYPLFVAEGEGCRLRDVDGNDYLDHDNCSSASLLGHAHPAIAAAIAEAAPRLLSAGAATESVHQWARLLCERYASVDRLRFCCSGTEAVMFACRAARAHTGRSTILRQAGSYFGSAPEVAVGMPYSQQGLARHAGADGVAVDFHDRAALERAAAAHRTELAGLLANGAWFSRGDGALAFLRELADAYGIPLIVDEVMSFRLAMGGAQEYFGVEADITVFGKFVGGGLAAGAFGGREEIMRRFDFQAREEPVHHGGTLAANPVTAAAGIAALGPLTPELFVRLNELGERLRSGFSMAYRRHGILGFAAGEGSLVRTGLGAPSHDPRRADQPKEVRELARLIGLDLLTRGHFTPAHAATWTISAPMTENEIDQTLADFDQVLAESRPALEQAAPELLV